MVDSWNDEHIFIVADGVIVWDSKESSPHPDSVLPNGWTTWGEQLLNGQPVDRYGCNPYDPAYDPPVYTCFLDVEPAALRTPGTITIGVTSDTNQDCDNEESFGVSRSRSSTSTKRNCGPDACLLHCHTQR